METMTTSSRPTLTIGILTMNEERRIEACIKSALFADEVIVVDSGSKDNTVQLAESLGAKVYHHTDWKGFAEQRNRLLQYCSSDYIFFLDADELIQSDLQSEIEAAVHSGQPDVWETYWLEVAFGRPLKRVVSRKSLPRLFRRDMLLGFDGVVHEHANLTNPDAKRHVFRSALWHYSRETIHDSLKKLTQYSMLGAAKRARKGRKGGVLYGLVSSTWMFIRLYIFKRAFLEGGPGFLYSFFIALEFFFRQAALKYDRPYLTDNLSR
ncbi:glycosyltransferase family 2 protein [Brachymonas sp. J145]|uniref:glycosyltransferase family 2 protein n=1 Tax=Brachymonas sp. J145 TaxID=3116489 RepID=UPI002E77935D|nr:glycosyltransferase family 2 protein [Brachymonas sp. J145]MEE1652437.1 glycosyltransferase family 2 protein [Brachymonas sp. J145]